MDHPARCRAPAGAVTLLLLLAALARGQTTGIVHSPHNLSASGAGTVHAATEQQVCIFCHTPHNAGPVQPLWNRQIPVAAYRVYASPSLAAAPGQPTGSSKLCLSCHDGTIAVGRVLSRNQTIPMAGGLTTIPPDRPANLGTDLSGDHPISFRYDSNLTSRNLTLTNPAALPRHVRLDSNRELQCSTCHDAHNNQYGNFLVMPNDQSQLCLTCHNQGTTQVASHQQCAACHQSHDSPSGPYLLQGATVADTCLPCHSGGSLIAPAAAKTVSARSAAAGAAAVRTATPLLASAHGPNVAAALAEVSTHDTKPPVNRSPGPNDTTCTDCHGAHTMKTGRALAPNVPPNFGRVRGVNAAGAAVSAASFEYEVCFKCHSEPKPVQPYISRQLTTDNPRLQFAPSAISFHPVEAAGKNTNVPSLVPGLTTASIMYCNDCHNADTGTRAGGSAANGVHGSAHRPLLLARYDTTDFSPESAAAYNLCYRCHDRTSILANQSFPFHKKHVVDQHTPCSVCHAAHGISSTLGNPLRNAHLIDFDTSIVRPTTGNRLYYESHGLNSGTCYLKCHNVDHNPMNY
jgi:predicted CXXCH cytochrome family protein